MKKSLAIVGIVSLLAMTIFTGCENAGSLGSAFSDYLAGKPAASGSDATTTLPPDITSSIPIVPITTTTEDSFYDNATNRYILQTKYETIRLDDSSKAAFPDLGEALDQFSKEISKSQKSAVDAINEDPQAKDFIREGMYYFDEYYIDNIRTDKDVFSMICTASSFYGGPHPNLTRTGISFDSKTGKKIEITDVVKSKKDLMSEVKKIVLRDYPDANFYDLDKSINDYVDNPDISINWVMTPYGICVIFNAYDLTPYAEGYQVANLTFKEYPDLFTDKYKAVEGAYVIPLSSFNSIYADLDNDGKVEKIDLEAKYDNDDDMYTDLTVSYGGKKCTQEDYFFSYTAKLIHTSDDRNYLYAIITSFNDSSGFMVFDLNNGELKDRGQIVASEPTYDILNADGEAYTVSPSGESKSSIEKINFINPDGFWLSKRVDALSTYQIKQFYKIGPDGVPTTTDKYGDCINNIYLVAKKEFKAKSVDIDTNELKDEVTVKVGDKIKIYRSNGTDTVIFETSDGKYIGLKYDQENKIDGTPAEDLFECLYYAG